MRPTAPEEGALLDVTQRLERQLEYQLERLHRTRERVDVDADLGLLEHLARRMQRDGARLRLLCGAQFAGGAAPRLVADLLSDMAAAAADPVRVRVLPTPIATIGPRADVELGLVIGEVVDGALAESAAGVTVSGRLGPAGLTVDVMIDGPSRAPGASMNGVAEALARRSSNGIQVHRSGPDGPYAIVLCPAAALSIPVQRRTEPARTPAMQEAGLPVGPGTTRSSPPRGRDPFGVHPNGSVGGTELFRAPPGSHLHVPPPMSAGLRAPVDADPLFGPLPTGTRLDGGADTPIYEAVASAWFQEAGGQPVNGTNDTNGDGAGWDSPGDLEWRAAAVRAARVNSEPPSNTTASGLPRRRPGRQMVTPSLQERGSGGEDPERQARTNVGSEERAPDRVRHRLDDYQRGLRQGRHRAIDGDPPAGDADWRVEPTA